MTAAATVSECDAEVGASMHPDSLDKRWEIPVEDPRPSSSETSGFAASDPATTRSALTCFIRLSRLFERQRRTLLKRNREIAQLRATNHELRLRADRTSQRAALESERVLHRLGADLHDGPAQLISFALMRLDAISASLSNPAFQIDACSNIERILSALSDALIEIRSICSGLSMPWIADLPIADAITSVIQEHERRTGTAVNADVQCLPRQIPYVIKTTLCRLVQEGLNNAFRHGDGKCQSVRAWTSEEALCVEIGDRGPGLRLRSHSRAGGGLGLVLMLHRIESLGGSMRLQSAPGQGTRLTGIMPIL